VRLVKRSRRDAHKQICGDGDDVSPSIAHSKRQLASDAKAPAFWRLALKRSFIKLWQTRETNATETAQFNERFSRIVRQNAGA